MFIMKCCLLLLTILLFIAFIEAGRVSLVLHEIFCLTYQLNFLKINAGRNSLEQRRFRKNQDSRPGRNDGGKRRANGGRPKKRMQKTEKKKPNNSKGEAKKCRGKMCRRTALTGRQTSSIVLKGKACDFVDFGAVRGSGSDCTDGSKMVLQPS